ncbi:MAG: lytic murein transglycosylase [Alphaproteobacteria bacterium]
MCKPVGQSQADDLRDRFADIGQGVGSFSIIMALIVFAGLPLVARAETAPLGPKPVNSVVGQSTTVTKSAQSLHQKSSIPTSLKKKAATLPAKKSGVAPKIIAQTTPAPAASPGGAEKEKAEFARWLKDFRVEAKAAGISDSTLKSAFADVSEPIQRVIELDRKQPEFTLTLDQYMERVVNPGRIERGRTLILENQALLDTVSAQYGVPRQFIVALWGIETDYGRITGGYSVVGALATLAFEGRRAQFFRTELLKALKIIDEGHISAGNMLGSWAGAMGQSQFMPSSFLSFAQDGDGDGRKDIWTSRPDVFASIANYLATSGWKGDRTWGEQVVLPDSIDRASLDTKNRKLVADWMTAGVTLPDGKSPTLDPNVQAAIVLPGGPDGPAYLVTENYSVFLKWNRSLYFATAAGTLADRLALSDPYAPSQ